MVKAAKFPKSPTQPLPGFKKDPEDEFVAGEFSDLEEPMPNFERAEKANQEMAKRNPEMKKYLKRLALVLLVFLFNRK